MRKTKFILPLLILLATYSFAQKVTPVTNTTSTTSELKWLSWNEGYPLAKKSGKILLIDMYTDWCGWCKKMDKDTYAKEEIIKMINDDFVPVKFNPEKTGIKYEVEGKTYTGRQLFAMLVQNNRIGYPTTLFLYTNEKKIYMQSGYQNAENFKALLNQYIDLKPQLTE